jgi:hypothetical protein
MAPVSQELEPPENPGRFRVSGREADRILRTYWDHDEDLVRWHVGEAKRMKALGKVQNAVGWLMAGLKNDYRPQRLLFADMRKRAIEQRIMYEDQQKEKPADHRVKDALDALHDSFSADEHQRQRTEI